MCLNEPQVLNKFAIPRTQLYFTTFSLETKLHRFNMSLIIKGPKDVHQMTITFGPMT